MERPERLTVPTCIGCGAMGRFGTCETGCREEKLELVRAAAHAAIASLEATAEKAAEAFREVAERLLSGTPEGDRQSQAAYCSLQEQARAALAEHVDPDDREIDWDEPAEAATTWWCPDCGAIDAPQPCLGICVWRPVEWVRRDLYERERERALVAHARQRALRQVLRRIAFVTPRPGQWERNWEALQTQAAQALGRAGRPPTTVTGDIRSGSGPDDHPMLAAMNIVEGEGRGSRRQPRSSPQ